MSTLTTKILKLNTLIPLFWQFFHIPSQSGDLQTYIHLRVLVRAGATGALAPAEIGNGCQAPVLKRVQYY